MPNDIHYGADEVLAIAVAMLAGGFLLGMLMGWAVGFSAGAKAASDARRKRA